MMKSLINFIFCCFRFSTDVKCHENYRLLISKLTCARLDKGGGMFALVLRFKAKTCNLRSWNFSSSRISRPARQDKNCDLNTNLSFNLFFCAVPQKYLSNFLKIKDWHIFNKQFITKFKRWCSNNWKDPTILTILISDHIYDHEADDDSDDEEGEGRMKKMEMEMEKGKVEWRPNNTNLWPRMAVRHAGGQGGGYLVVRSRAKKTLAISTDKNTRFSILHFVLHIRFFNMKFKF